MTTISATRCDSCGEITEQAFVITTPITTVKSESHLKDVKPGDYCRGCLLGKLQALIPNKVVTRGFTPKDTGETIVQAKKCSFCPDVAVFELIAQDSDILGYSCQKCKDTKPQSSSMYR